MIRADARAPAEDAGEGADAPSSLDGEPQAFPDATFFPDAEPRAFPDATFFPDVEQPAFPDATFFPDAEVQALPDATFFPDATSFPDATFFPDASIDGGRDAAVPGSACSALSTCCSSGTPLDVICLGTVNAGIEADCSSQLQTFTTLGLCNTAVPVDAGARDSGSRDAAAPRADSGAPGVDGSTLDLCAELLLCCLRSGTAECVTLATGGNQLLCGAALATFHTNGQCL